MFGTDDAIGAGIGLAGNLFQTIEGEQQKSEGEALAASNKRPKYAIPKEYDAAISNIRGLLNYKIPGYNTATDRLTGSTSQAIANAKEVGRNPSDILNTLGRANSSENTGIQNIDIASAQNFNNQNEAYRNAMLAKVPAENLAFDYNENQPYQAKATKANALIGAGLQNANQGIQGIGNTAGKLTTSSTVGRNHGDMLNLIKQLYGSSGGTQGLQQLIAKMNQGSGVFDNSTGTIGQNPNIQWSGGDGADQGAGFEGFNDLSSFA